MSSLITHRPVSLHFWQSRHPEIFFRQRIIFPTAAPASFAPARAWSIWSTSSGVRITSPTIVPGSPVNLKITQPGDLELLVGEERRSARRDPGVRHLELERGREPDRARGKDAVGDRILSRLELGDDLRCKPSPPRSRNQQRYSQAEDGDLRLVHITPSARSPAALRAAPWLLVVGPGFHESGFAGQCPDSTL